MEQLVSQYEKENQELRTSNQEQTQDIQMIIQTVNELKLELESKNQLAAAKDLELISLRTQNETAIKTLKQQHQN